jgi:hypothetical protein
MFPGIMPGALFVNHRGQGDGRGLSPRLWDRAVAPMLAPAGDTIGNFSGDDFRSFGIGTAVSSNVGYYVGSGGPYYSFEDTGNAIAQLATYRQGAVRLSTDADTDSETWLQAGNATSVMSVISDTAGDDKLLVFEARVRMSDLVGNRFIGLGEEAFAADSAITDAGALVDKDWIGFFALEGAPTILKFGYKKSGQTVQVPIASGLQTLAVDTWYKMGFIYDPSAPTSERIKVFVDNVENITKVTGTNIAAATFPDGEELSPVFGVKNVTDIMLMDIDWWALFQEG